MARKKNTGSDSALLSDLKAESAALATDIAAKAALKAQVDKLIAVYEGGAEAAPMANQRKKKIANRSKLKDAPDDGPFYGMSLPEAGTEQLRRTGTPQTSREIWLVLKDAGFKTSSSDPVKAVNWALRRWEKKHGNVLLVGDGKWGLRDWYTEERLKEIKASRGMMPGRDKEEHIRRMKKGIANLQARGAHYGRRLKMTPEVIGTLRRLIEEGKSTREACKQVGVSVSSFQVYKRDGHFKGMKPGSRANRVAEPDLLSPASGSRPPNLHMVRLVK